MFYFKCSPDREVSVRVRLEFYYWFSRVDCSWTAMKESTHPVPAKSRPLLNRIESVFALLLYGAILSGPQNFRGACSLFGSIISKKLLSHNRLEPMSKTAIEKSSNKSMAPNKGKHRLKIYRRTWVQLWAFAEHLSPTYNRCRFGRYSGSRGSWKRQHSWTLRHHILVPCPMQCMLCRRGGRKYVRYVWTSVLARLCYWIADSARSCHRISEFLVQFCHRMPIKLENIYLSSSWILPNDVLLTIIGESSAVHAIERYSNVEKYKLIV